MTQTTHGSAGLHAESPHENSVPTTGMGGATQAGTTIPARMNPVIGDRPCAACGFNLHGQLMVREPYYGMLIVRCPECSTVTPMIEYPSLGRWSVRLSRLAACVFVMAVLALFAGTSIGMAGIASEFKEAVTRQVARKIAQDHQEFQKAQATQAATTGAAKASPLPIAALSGWEYDQIDTQWWASVDQAAYAAMAPSFWTSLNPREAVGLIGLSLLWMAVGCLWSVLLCVLRRRNLIVFAVIVGLVATLMLYSMIMTMNSGWPGQKLAYVLAQETVPDYGAWWVLGIEGVMLIAGLYAGRSLVRMMLRCLLVPRYLYVFGWLWTCDNRPLPRTRRA